MTGYVLAIDQGTTNTKALLLTATGAIAAQSALAVPVRYPQPGWVEQSGAEIWDSVAAAVAACLAQIESRGAIAAIGISNQRESILLWNRRSGETIGPCVTWQCRRSADRLDSIRSPAVEALVAGKTGLALDPLFPAAKIGWLLDTYPEAKTLAGKGDLCAGTVDSWLVFRLTGGRVHATDQGNASRTQLFDIRRGNWSEELAAVFAVPANILPEVRSSDSRFGTTGDAGPLPVGIPIHAVLGDSHAALFGHGIRSPGPVKATYGTGSSLMTLTATPVASHVGLSTTIAWQRGSNTSYALEGNISVSGQAAAWVADLLGLEDANALTALAARVPDSNGVCLVPAFVGLGAPHWNDRVRAVLSGMSLSTTRAHIARAALEAIAFQVVDVFSAMEADLQTELPLLSTDGGATRNDLLMQIQADILGRPILRCKVPELSAFGAGALAGTASGFWSEADVARLLSVADDRFLPVLESTARAKKLSAWRDAVRAAIGATAISVG